MNNITCKNVNVLIINEIIEDNKKYLKFVNNPNVKYFFKLPDNTVINIYNNKTILIQGINANQFAEKYNLDIKNTKKEEIIKIQLPNIGCDEVGVGDFFGPLVTCACFLEKDFEIKNKELLKLIKDSKNITNERIKELFLVIKDKVNFEVYIMKNNEYNEKYNFYKNTHILKALAHNYSLLKLTNLNNQLKDVSIIMDQFVNKEKYFHYLKQEEKIIENIYFETKAESKYLSVACASIIARYYFLNEIEKLEKKYKIKLPLGAGNNVKLLVQNYKINFKSETTNFIKLHFNDQIKK